MIFKKIIGHFNVITKHRWKVFKLCCRVGLPWRGLVHDLSKYSPTEFWESVKYFNGEHSPILDCRKDKGYSEAWLHHKGRNKHHLEYWVDIDINTKKQFGTFIPYKYVAEMLCDKLAAGMTYKGKDWTEKYELEYWQHERKIMIVNENIDKLITEFFEQVANVGYKKMLKKKKIKQLYIKYKELNDKKI